MAEARPKKRRSEEYMARRREIEKERTKTRIYIGESIQRWRELRWQKGFESDAQVAKFLLDCIDGKDITRWKGRQRSLVIQRQQEFQTESYVGADEVIVKLECLLPLFQKCFECCSKCSISKARDGKLFYVTQECQKCRFSREWTSHPPQQEIRDKADNQEVAEETVTLSFGDSDTESAEEEDVKGDILWSQSEEEEEDENVVKDHHPLSQPFVSEGVLDNASEDLGHIRIEKVEDSGIQICAVPDSRLHGEKEDESFLSDSSVLEEEMVEEKERQCSDDDWVPSCEDVSLQSSEGEESGSESEPRRESHLHLPLVWCTDCQTEFKRSCFAMRHRRLYGCLLCGSREDDQRNTGGANQVAPDSSSMQCGQDIGDGHKLDPSTKSNQHTLDCTNQTIICSNKGSTSDGIHMSHNSDLQDLCTKSNHEVTRDNDPEANSNNTKEASDEDRHRILNIQCLHVRFSDLDSFQAHAQQCHGIKRFRELCPDCGKFITMVNKVEGGPPHICEYKVKPNYCEICGKRFATRVGLRIHTQNIHSEKYELPCHYCLKPFKLKKNKLEHEKIHLNEELKFYCPDCPQRFADHLSRNIHRKTHWTQGRYFCKVCNKAFSEGHRLRRHEVIHSGLKPYACQLCDRSFNQPGHLKSHMRLHTGEKPFKCQDCGKCFNHNVSLKNHIKQHHGPLARKGGQVPEEEQ